MDRSPKITVDRWYLDELKKKAVAWDKLQANLREIQASSVREDINLSLSLGSKIDMSRAVPFNQTILVTNLPSTTGGAELMYSFLAPGGIRCYKLFFDPAKGKRSVTALITFASTESAKNYLSYISKCGVFFLSERLPESYIGLPSKGEYLKASADGKIKFLLKSPPGVTISPWMGVERVAGKIITGDEGGYCKVAHEMKQGATRVLLIFPGMEPKHVHEQLKHLVAIPELKIEINRLLPARAPRKGRITILRFSSVRDAVMAKTYLSLLKIFSGPEGRTVEYCADPMDHPTEDLGWHKLRLQELNKLTASPKATKSAVLEVETAHKEIEVPVKKNVHKYSSYMNGAEESDDDVDEMRELSFSLAKEAFRPHIPTSPTGQCLPSLCHTPAGDLTPAQLEYKPQSSNDIESGDQETSQEVKAVAPKANETIVPAVVIKLETATQPEHEPKKAREPIETSLSEEQAIGKQEMATSKKDIGVSRESGGLKAAVSLPNLGLVKKFGQEAEAINNKNSSATSPSGAEVQGLPSYSLTFNRLVPSAPNEAKTPSTVHEDGLERYCKGDGILLNMMQKEALKKPEPEKQVLEFAVPKHAQCEALGSDKLTLKSEDLGKKPELGDENILGRWGDDF